MPLDPVTRAQIEHCIRSQSRLHMVLAGIAAAMGIVIFGLVAFAPMKPGEEGIVVGFAVFGAVLLVVSGVVWRGTSSRAARIRALVYDAPQQIGALAVHTSAPANSAIKATALRMTTTGGEVVMLLVPNEAVGHALMAAVQRASVDTTPEGAR